MYVNQGFIGICFVDQWTLAKEDLQAEIEKHNKVNTKNSNNKE